MRVVKERMREEAKEITTFYNLNSMYKRKWVYPSVVSLLTERKGGKLVEERLHFACWEQNDTMWAFEILLPKVLGIGTTTCSNVSN